MNREIERKFLLKSDKWQSLADKCELYMQGYIFKNKQKVVRIRVTENQAFLTIKGSTTISLEKKEFEYEIPKDDAKELLKTLCDGPIIHKKRYKLQFQGFTWEIDRFYGKNEGLVIAEIELEDEDQSFPKPPWLGEEVSSDPRYYNSSLTIYPYKEWSD